MDTSRFKFIALSLWLSVANAAADEPALISITTGSVAGAYFDVGLAICDEINKRRNDETTFCFVQGSNGSEENLTRILSGTANLAIVQSDVFQAQKQLIGHKLAVLYSEPLHIFLPEDSELVDLKDAAGLRIDIGTEGSGTRYAALRVLETLGVPANDLGDFLSLAPIDKIDALCRGDVDASFWLSAEANAVAVKAMDECSALLLSIEASDIQRLEHETGLRSYRFKRTVYGGEAESVQTVGVDALLIASDRLPRQTRDHVLQILSKVRSTLIHNSRYLTDDGFILSD